MRKFTGILFVLWANMLFGQTYGDYYQSAEGLKDDALKVALNTIIKGHTEFEYTSSSTDVWDILKQTDKDPNNPNNVILLYSGQSYNAAQEYNDRAGWSREHVWAKSRGNLGDDFGAGTDVHHLRPEDVSINSTRNNRSFDVSQTREAVWDNGLFTGSYKDENNYTFEPRDAVKGDVARMLFYMAVRYEGEGTDPDLELTESLPGLSDTNPLHGRLSTLVKWNREDPVDDWERNRNEIIYTDYQHNRNPFIDFPDLAEFFWGNAIGLTWSSKFSTFPKDGEIDVAINTTIRYVFSESIRNIDNSEITDANVASLITLKETDNTGTDVVFTASIDADKKVITVIPNSNLNYLQLYYSSVEAVEDENENVNVFTEISFTTIEQDVTAPTFISTPTHLDIDVDIYNPIIITFNEPVRNQDDSEITNDNVANLLSLKETDANGADVAFTAIIDYHKKIITATTSEALKFSQQYFASIQAVEDFSNNPSVANTMTFTTKAEATESTVIISQYYEGVSGSDKFIEITNIGNSSVDLSSYHLGRFSNTDAPEDLEEYADGGPLSGTIAAGATRVYRNSGAVNPSYAVSLSITTTTATYFNGNDPVALLKDGTTWRHRVDCLYGDGTWGLDRSFYRKATVAAANKNKSVLDGNGEWIEVSCAAVDIANPESIEYLGTHSYGAGTGEDETAPTYTSSPDNGAINVNITNTITLTFDEAIRNINDSEITDANASDLISLFETNKSGEAIAYTSAIDTDKKILTITPEASLNYDQVYYLTVDPVEDNYNNASAPSEFSFTTMSSDIPTSFWTLDFETEGGYTTSVEEFTDFDPSSTYSGYDYFLRTDGSTIAEDAEFSNRFGSFFFGAQDLDGEGASLPLELNINDIDISGKNITGFSVYLAEDKASDAAYDWDKSDYVKFQYDVDNSGTFTDLFWIYGDGSTFNSQPSIDADFDALGDGVDFLTDVFTEIITSLDINGTTLDIKIIFNLNGGDEDIAIDNLSLKETVISTAITHLDAEKVNIYPNPNNGNFFIKLGSAFKSNVTIEVFNMMGKKVFETNSSDQKTEVDLRAMKRGIYFIRVMDGENIYSQKIIKQ